MGVVPSKIADFNKSAITVKNKLFSIENFKKPRPQGFAAFFPEFISAQRFISRTPMNGSLVCSTDSSENVIRNGWVFLNCSLY